LMEGLGTRYFVSHDTNAGQSPLLHVEYDFVPEPPVENIAVQITNGNDDAEEASSNGSVTLSSPDLEISEDPQFLGGPETVGLRFNNL
ncbi:MAG: hypothetical protein KDE28_18790, partial [Anaerolineales bacterium]|nr:hypothetical protein [Anaerolineales bacterium]